MIYRKVYRKKIVSPDGRVVTESTSFVETSCVETSTEDQTSDSQQVSVKVTAQSGLASISASGRSSSVSCTASISASGHASCEENS